MSSLESLPLSLQHCLLLEWLTPECVWTAARASGTLRRAAMSVPLAFRSSYAPKRGCALWFMRLHLRLLQPPTPVHFFRLRGDEMYFKDKCGQSYCDPPHEALYLRRTQRIHVLFFRIEGKIMYHTPHEWHRDDDLPAVTYHCGTKNWFQFGYLHRDGDQPAVIGANKTQRWYRGDRLHRDGDKPAVVCPDGTQEWWQHGKRHRDGDLPAIVRADGTRYWYRRGTQHRDGKKPAWIGDDGTEAWYKNGKLVKIV